MLEQDEAPNDEAPEPMIIEVTTSTDKVIKESHLNIKIGVLEISREVLITFCMTPPAIQIPVVKPPPPPPAEEKDSKKKSDASGL